MKMLIAQGAGKTALVEVEEVAIKNPTEVKIRVKYCGVCMSEHYAWKTAEAGRSFGHEPVGVVTEVGSAVTRVRVGDRVSGLFGGKSEYVIADERKVFALPDSISDEDGILEPLACLISAVSKVRIPVIGARVAVVGCGYMGCGAISLLKKRGAYVVAVDIRPESVENALKYGADEAYLVEDLPERCFFIPGSGLNFDGTPGGFPLVMEWGETNESLDLAIRMTAQCGQIAIGAYHTGGKRLVDVEMLNVKAIDCLSTHPRERELSIAGCRSAIEMYEQNAWSFRHVPTKVYPASMFDRAHEELETKFGSHLKSVIDFTREDFEPYVVC